MGIKSSKEGGKKRKKVPDISVSFENRINTSPPLTISNHSEFGWQLKFEKDKIRTLESELKSCKLKIEVLEEEKKITLEKYEKYEEYKFLSEYYLKQIEEYKSAEIKHDEEYMKLQNVYDEKIEYYKNQLKEYQSSFKLMRKYEKFIESQKIAHRLDLLDLEKRLLESKIKVLNSPSNYDINKEIEKDRNRLQEIYDEAFMSHKYLANIHCLDEESRGHLMIEKESNRKTKSKDYNIAKCIGFYGKHGNHGQRNSESTKSLSYSTRESTKTMPESVRQPSFSSRDSHRLVAKCFESTTESRETEHRIQ